MIGTRDSGVKMVTNGLRIFYDAAQLRSYTGSGTTWSDLSGNGDTGTLTNGPTFNSSNGGSIVFDRTDDYVTSTSQSNINFSPTNGYTIGSWVYPEFTSTDFNDQFSAHIAGRGNPTVNGDFHFVLMLGWASFGMGQVRGVAFGYDGFNSFGYIATTNRWTNNDWNYVVVTHLSNVVKFYINGTSIGSISNIGTYDRNNSGHRYAISHTTTTGGKYRGRVAISHAYNRVLSDAEILQNYNANKSRFNFNIVSDSLIMHLDASDRSSYPASGSIWTDLSGNGNGGNLIYGNFDAGNGGALWFNQLGASGGNPDYFYKADNSTIRFGSPNFSFGCWFYWPNTGNVSSAAISKRWDGSGNFAQWALRIGNGDFSGLTTGKKIGALFIPDTGSPNTSISADLPNQATWVHVFVVIATTQQKVYLNGIDSATTNTNLTGKTFNITNRKLVVGGLNDNTDNNLLLSWGFKTACFYLYNRNLSAQEVLQNYNATRVRFGL